MNTPSQTDVWIYHIFIVLGLIIVASGITAITLMVMGRPVQGIFIALGAVALGGLVRLLVSPLNREL